MGAWTQAVEATVGLWCSYNPAHSCQIFPDTLTHAQQGIKPDTGPIQGPTGVDRVDRLRGSDREKPGRTCQRMTTKQDTCVLPFGRLEHPNWP